MSEQELLRADVLIAAARREARLLGGAKGEYPKELVERLADALEAATGGQHIEAVMQLESAIRRARKAPPVETFEGGIRQDSVYTILDGIATERKLLMTENAQRYSHLLEEYDVVKLRLTEKTVRLTAIIEKALGEARASSIPLGMPESLFYWQMLRRVESTLAEYRIETGDDHEEHEFCDPRLGCILSEDPASWIRKRAAEKWEEGRAAWAKYELALSDAEASGQGYRVQAPVNPYLVEEKNGDKDTSSTQ